MIEQIKQFFKDNAEATEVHVALGYLHSNKEEALNRLKGVADESVKTYTREQVEGNQEGSSDARLEDSKLIKQFKKLPLEKMPTVIKQQEDVVAKKKASLMASDNIEKDQKALKFHEDILAIMQTAQAEKAQEEAQKTK